jgi:hypothetical protein
LTASRQLVAVVAVGLGLVMLLARAVRAAVAHTTVLLLTGTLHRRRQVRATTVVGATRPPQETRRVAVVVVRVPLALPVPQTPQETAATAPRHQSAALL